MVKEEDEGEDVDENEECGDDDAFFFTLKGGVKPVLRELKNAIICKLFCWWMGVPKFSLFQKRCG